MARLDLKSKFPSSTFSLALAEAVSGAGVLSVLQDSAMSHRHPAHLPGGPAFLQFSFSVSCFMGSFSALLNNIVSGPKGFQEDLSAAPFSQSLDSKPGVVLRVPFGRVVCLHFHRHPLLASPLVPGTTHHSPFCSAPSQPVHHGQAWTQPSRVVSMWS